jgi:hypothetical protein
MKMNAGEYQKTKNTIDRLHKAGLYVDLSQNTFVVKKYSNNPEENGEYDCYEVFETLEELEAFLRGLVAAERLVKNTDYSGFAEQ